MIFRYITQQVIDSLRPSKVVGVFGPRRSGKTVLMNFVKEKMDRENILMVHGESLDVIEVLSSQRTGTLKRFIGKNKYLFIDEAQKILSIHISVQIFL